MTTKKPTAKFRHGQVSLAVWENEGKDGAFQTFTLERSYVANKGEEGEEFKNTGSFGMGSDLGNIERCLFDLKVYLAANRQQ